MSGNVEEEKPLTTQKGLTKEDWENLQMNREAGFDRWFFIMGIFWRWD